MEPVPIGPRGCLVGGRQRGDAVRRAGDLHERTEWATRVDLRALADHELLGDVLVRQARSNKCSDLTLSCRQLRTCATSRRGRRLGHLDRKDEPETSRPAFELTQVPGSFRLAPVGKDRRELSLGGVAIAGRVSPDQELNSSAPRKSLPEWHCRLPKELGALAKDRNSGLEIPFIRGALRLREGALRTPRHA